jgi:hypothetical protein
MWRFYEKYKHSEYMTSGASPLYTRVRAYRPCTICGGLRPPQNLMTPASLGALGVLDSFPPMAPGCSVQPTGTVNPRPGRDESWDIDTLDNRIREPPFPPPGRHGKECAHKQRPKVTVINRTRAKSSSRSYQAPTTPDDNH